MAKFSREKALITMVFEEMAKDGQQFYGVDAEGEQTNDTNEIIGDILADIEIYEEVAEKISEIVGSEFERYIKRHMVVAEGIKAKTGEYSKIVTFESLEEKELYACSDFYQCKGCEDILRCFTTGEVESILTELERRDLEEKEDNQKSDTPQKRYYAVFNDECIPCETLEQARTLAEDLGNGEVTIIDDKFQVIEF